MESEIIFRDVSTVLPESDITDQLSIAVDSELIRVEIVEAINGIPTMYLVDYLKESCGGVEALSEWDGSVLTYLVERCDPPLSQSRTEIFAIGADEVVASKLSIPEGKPVQYQVDTYFSNSGEILGIGFLYILTDHFHFFVNRRVV
jgi:DNA-binding GntR family transcriptional regulator